MSLHKNNGACPYCTQLFNKYPGFSQSLRGWFVFFQAKHPEFHISCAGRGAEAQEAAKAAGKSRASYGESAHNYNAALDGFIQLPKVDMYDKKWFTNVLAPEIPFFINWYGSPDSEFFELPHLEVRDWRRLKALNEIKLVEPMPELSA
jgi:hypothetical protein